MRFPFVRPQIPPPSDWVHFLEASYKHRYFTNFGPAEQALTQGIRGRFAADGTACVLCSNATAGLTAALVASGCRGKVLVPAFTFPATVHAVLAAQLQPVICDVDAETWEVSYVAAQTMFKQIPDIGAIMPVRVFGYVRDQSLLAQLADNHRVAVVVDSAAALGASKVACSHAVALRAEVFSLHATKSFGIGEGGAIFVNPRYEEGVKRALNFGLKADRSFGLGLNGKMSEVQAAVGLSVLERAEGMVARRREMCAFYDQFLERYPTLSSARHRGSSPSTNFPVLMPESMDVEALCEGASHAGLQLRRYYFPSLSTVSIPGVLQPYATPIADNLASRMVCFPVYSDATDAELEEISQILERLLGEFLCT